MQLTDMVRFKDLNAQALYVLETVQRAFDVVEVEPTLTGAAQDFYPEGGVHRAGYAWDFRIWDLPEDLRLVTVCRVLKWLTMQDKRYYVLYGDKDHVDHFHVGYHYTNV